MEVLQVFEGMQVNGFHILLLSELLDPRILDSFQGWVSILTFKFQHFLDQIFHITRDVIPFWRGETKFTKSNAIKDLAIILTIERRVATE